MPLHHPIGLSRLVSAEAIRRFPGDRARAPPARRALTPSTAARSSASSAAATSASYSDQGRTAFAALEAALGQAESPASVTLP